LKTVSSAVLGAYAPVQSIRLQRVIKLSQESRRQVPPPTQPGFHCDRWVGAAAGHAVMRMVLQKIFPCLHNER
jgi:hypothetical protein